MDGRLRRATDKVPKVLKFYRARGPSLLPSVNATEVQKRDFAIRLVNDCYKTNFIARDITSTPELESFFLEVGNNSGAFATAMRIFPEQLVSYALQGKPKSLKLSLAARRLHSWANSPTKSANRKAILKSLKW